MNNEVISIKQRIYMEQLTELQNEQKERIREWWYGSPPRVSDVYAVLVKYDDGVRYEGPHVNIGSRDFLTDYHTGEAIPLLSIGQMIEIIESHYAGRIGSYNKNENGRLWTTYFIDIITGESSYKSETLYAGRDRQEYADVLWAILKKIL